jgi:3-oxoacyl-[acyl-carrier protein] reductase
MNKLTGKSAVVTGASKGIGAAIARSLAEAGAAVVVNYASDEDNARRVVADINAKGGKAIALQGDVSQLEQTKRIFEQAEVAHGKIDVLVNNAGVYQYSPIEAISESDFHRQFNINVLGVVLSTQQAIAHFNPAGGSIVNISSVASRATAPTTLVYAATKAAVDAITHVLSKELGPRNIRVNSINPGAIDTEGTRALGLIGSDFAKQILAQTPLGRLGVPDDVAPVAVFLASEESRWITGETIYVSGGM